jgi:hypothetical protein
LAHAETALFKEGIAVKRGFNEDKTQRLITLTKVPDRDASGREDGKDNKSCKTFRAARHAAIRKKVGKFAVHPSSRPKF